MSRRGLSNTNQRLSLICLALCHAFCFIQINVSLSALFKSTSLIISSALLCATLSALFKSTSLSIPFVIHHLGRHCCPRPQERLPPGLCRLTLPGADYSPKLRLCANGDPIGLCRQHKKPDPPITQGEARSSRKTRPTKTGARSSGEGGEGAQGLQCGEANPNQRLVYSRGKLNTCG